MLASTAVPFDPTFTQMYTREDRLFEEFEEFAGAGDAVVNQTKAARNRNKKRKAKKEAQYIFGVCNSDSGSEVASQRNEEGEGEAGPASSAVHLSESSSGCTLSATSSSLIDLQEQGKTNGVGQGRRFINNSFDKCINQPNSYAAAVSGRSHHREFRTRIFQASPKLDKGTFSADNMSSASIKKSSSLHSVRPFCRNDEVALDAERKDVGIQVPEVDVTPGAGNEVRNDIKYETRGTNTIRKRYQRNKGVVAKLCCSDEDVKPSAVEFHGQDFTFETTLAKLVSRLGITFLDNGSGDADIQLLQD